ncbi:MAG: RtcB family protein [Coriobacteriia bacterium]|nr:RtcB family protein [Coriobacteriia bacterium]
MKKLAGRFGEGIIYNSQVEAGAVEQVLQLLNTPLAEQANLRVMPDVHAGAGSVIGTTMRISDKVCPNLVGVDIGCGVMATPLVGSNADALHLVELDRFIRKNIPSGFAKRKDLRLSPLAQQTDIENLRWDAPAKYRLDDALASVGTLGGGNHFIEIGTDSTGEAWLSIHSGSRNLGLQIALHYQKLAELTCGADVPRDLKYLSGDLLDDYLADMKIMQEYATLNRIAICADILEFLGLDPDNNQIFDRSITTIHNYIDLGGDLGGEPASTGESKNTSDHHILRKGAVRALHDELFLLPLNMADGMLLCRGKGNADWNQSAPHGAGRTLSRSRAFKSLDMAEFVQRMEGIYSTSVHDDTLDESPMAYKDGSEIAQLMAPSAQVLDHFKPIYSFKARGTKGRKRGGGSAKQQKKSARRSGST